MPTLEEVREQIGRLPAGGGWLGRKEIRQLPSILWEDEVVEKLVTGRYEHGNGVLVATNKRLIFVDKGLTTLRVEDFPYDKLTSIQYKTGMIFGEITIYASGNKAEIDHVEKNHCKAFADSIRARITSVSESVLAPAEPSVDPLAQLERLAALRASGALTEEEFAAQKAKLLG